MDTFAKLRVNLGEELRGKREQREQGPIERQRNEQQRVNQEQARVQEYAQLKADAVAATGAANDAATLANQKAQLAADKAALAVAAATLANQKAQLAVRAKMPSVCAYGYQTIDRVWHCEAFEDATVQSPYEDLRTLQYLNFAENV